MFCANILVVNCSRSYLNQLKQTYDDHYEFTQFTKTTKKERTQTISKKKRNYFGNHWESSHSKDSLDVSSCFWLSDFNFVLKRKIQKRTSQSRQANPSWSLGVIVAQDFKSSLILSNNSKKNEPGKILISD